MGLCCHHLCFHLRGTLNHNPFPDPVSGCLVGQYSCELASEKQNMHTPIHSATQWFKCCTYPAARLMSLPNFLVTKTRKLQWLCMDD